MRRFGKWFGLAAVLGGLLLAVPGSASAAGWSGGGHAYVGGHGNPGYHPGVGPVGGWRGAAVPGRGVAPGWHGGYPRGYVHGPVARVWVPGYWGFHGGTRVWIGGTYAYPPQPGWFWVAPHWQWNGYQWVWQAGYWSPPSY